VTGITLSEAWKRTAKAPRRRFAPASPRTGAAFAREHHYRLRCLSGKSRMAWSSAAGKNIPLRRDPKSPLQTRHPAPARGAYRDRHGRWARDAMDAAASGARGVAGRISVSDQPARRRPALKRLRRNLGRQHMSRSRGFGGGSRGRQKRVVLAPVAGVKLMEILEAQPGFGESPIHQRRWQDEFVARESAL
jgi:hypothetical protein